MFVKPAGKVRAERVSVLDTVIRKMSGDSACLLIYSQNVEEDGVRVFRCIKRNRDERGTSRLIWLERNKYVEGSW